MVLSLGLRVPSKIRSGFPRVLFDDNHDQFFALADELNESALGEIFGLQLRLALLYQTVSRLAHASEPEALGRQLTNIAFRYTQEEIRKNKDSLDFWVRGASSIISTLSERYEISPAVTDFIHLLQTHYKYAFRLIFYEFY